MLSNKEESSVKKCASILSFAMFIFAVAPVPHSGAQGTNINDVMTMMQVAAADLVRETSFEDTPGSQRAYGEFQTLFATNAEAIRAKSPESHSSIEPAMRALKTALDAGDLKQASDAATTLLKVVNDAVEKVTGVAGGTKQGLVLIVEQMKAAVRDLKEEVKFKDVPGMKRAAEAFHKLYNASADEIKAKSSEAGALIEQGLKEVNTAVAGGDNAKVAAAADRMEQLTTQAENLLLSSPR
jgi:hypothetical protein